MKFKFKNYKHLAGLLAVILLAIGFVELGAPIASAIGIVGTWQLSQFVMSKSPGYCFTTVFTPEQVKELEGILKGMKGYEAMLKTLFDFAGKNEKEGGIAVLLAMPEELKKAATQNQELRDELKKLKKQLLSAPKAGVNWRTNSDGRREGFVSDECARAIASLFIVSCAQQGRWPSSLAGEEKQARLLAEACEMLSIQQRAASSLTGTEVPLPTVYVPQIVELVWNYGQMRQYGTVYPLGAGTVKLPRLKAGEDAFAYLGVGTAGMSQSVTKKQVTAELVTFTANKFGGLIAIPYELEEDTFIPLGQFLARYIARRFAYGEDDTAFNGDGTSTYANIAGIGKYCNDGGSLTYSVQLAATKTKPSDATLNDFRAMRQKVNAAAYFDSAYYLHPTMDALLVTFNTIGQPLVYQRNGMNATLDGFPIRWTGVCQAYSTAAQAAKDIAYFGALSYWFLGERGAPRVETSRDVYFATDEIAMRALERIDVEALAIDAMSTLRTAAA